MKTIVFIEFYLAGGSSNGLIEEIKYIQRAAPQYAVVVVGSPGSTLENASKKGNFEFYSIAHTSTANFRSFSLMSVRIYLATLKTLFWIMLRHKPALIHCYHYAWSIYANPLGLIFNVPVIIHLKDVWLLEPKLARVFMKCNSRSLYIAVSRYVYSLFTDVFHINKNRTITLFDGVNRQVFYPPLRAAIEKKQMSLKKTIVYFSRIDTHRDIDIFLQVALELHEEFPDLEFIHCGHNPKHSHMVYYQTLQNQVTALGMQKYFQLRPYESNPQKVAGILRRSYVSIIPAKRFALSNSAIEALMCGVPVIAYRTGGNAEVVDHGSTGYLVNVNYAHEYVTVLKKMMRIGFPYTEMAIEASKQATQRFDSDMLFGQLLNIYAQLTDT